MVPVEGATHGFTPCTNCPGAPFGDTVKRLFDYLDTWLTEPDAFKVLRKLNRDNNAAVGSRCARGIGKPCPLFVRELEATSPKTSIKAPGASFVGL